MFWQRYLDFWLWLTDRVFRIKQHSKPPFVRILGRSTAQLLLPSKVFNDIYEALEWKRFCVALFIDLFKAFGTVDQSLWVEILFETGTSKQTASCFANYLTSRMQSVRRDGASSTFLEVIKGVAQSSVLGCILFTIYRNETCQMPQTISTWLIL